MEMVIFVALREGNARQKIRPSAACFFWSERGGTLKYQGVRKDVSQKRTVDQVAES
jgi:hypothetical protein